MTADTLMIASDAHELATAQHGLIERVAEKIAAAIEVARETKQMVADMLAVRLDPRAAKRQLKRESSRVAYLTKIKGALEAGYCMMPDMPGEIVAVRIARPLGGPSIQARSWSPRWRGVPDEQTTASEAGTGDYWSPRQQIETTKFKNEKGEDVTHQRAIALRDPDGLDRKFIRPEVMSRTSRAMARRIFDEVVTVRHVTTRRRANRDPIVLGRIVDKENKVVAAFLIAWFVDPSEL